MDCLSEHAESTAQMMRGCEGVMGKLQTHWRCLYELSTMKRRATACFVPRWIKKSSSLSVSLRGIISPKSEQINHLEKNEGGCVCVCVCWAIKSLCVSPPSVSVHPCVCSCVQVRYNIHVCVCVCLCDCQLESQQTARGSGWLFLYRGVVGGEGLARGSMIKMLNQTPCSNITAESCNFNFFRPVDTNK